jgi:hypothetical protein
VQQGFTAERTPNTWHSKQFEVQSYFHVSPSTSIYWVVKSRKVGIGVHHDTQRRWYVRVRSFRLLLWRKKSLSRETISLSREGYLLEYYNIHPLGEASPLGVNFCSANM